MRTLVSIAETEAISDSVRAFNAKSWPLKMIVRGAVAFKDGTNSHFFNVIIEAIDKIAGPAGKIPGFGFDEFPAHSGMRQGSMQGFVHYAASRVKVAASSKASFDSLREFDELVERVQNHFRNVAEANDFGSALFSKWMLRSLRQCTDEVIDLWVSKPQAAEHWICTVDRRLSWLIAVFPWFFHHKGGVADTG